MKKSLLTHLCGSVLVLLLSSTTTASDQKAFIGSSCSFADRPLSSHNRIHHRFKNTSGSSQWVTCPLVRDNVTNNIEWAGLDTVGTTSNVRLEMRHQLNGTLVGWNAYGSTNTGGTGRQHYWFNGSVSGNAANYAALAMEVYLGDDAYINMYRINEN